MSALLKEPSLRMRPMEEADLATVLDVERAGYPHPWTEGNRSRARRWSGM